MGSKVVFHNVTKQYSLYGKKSDKLMDLLPFRNKRSKTNTFQAVKNVSFEIMEGESVGIVGFNGSGKSTLCNLLAKVIPVTSGQIEINGETSLIAISAGLNNQLSGMENIELKCLMHGMTQKEINTLKPSIIEFAEIGKFINQPVKNFSSGMKSRLGFAISIHTNPDIMIIDEALSVGDQTFYQKCIDKMEQFKQDGKTIIFISHSISQVRSFCDRVLWMNYGVIEKFGETEEVLKEYAEAVKTVNAMSETEKKQHKQRMASQQYEKADVPIHKKETANNQIQDLSFRYQLALLIVACLYSAGSMFGLFG
ncbi:MAG: ABC transporter ATP-binding protein [Bacillus sp. (in: firmicutes)]